MRLLNTFKENIKIHHKSEHLLFEINNIDVYLSLKKFVVDLESIKGNKVLLILSGINEGYETYKTHKIYNESLSSIMCSLKKVSIIITKEKRGYINHYVIISKSNLIMLESKLFEVCVLFRFSSIYDLLECKTEDEINRNIERFSFYGIFSFKRWYRFISSQMFFDGEHLAGRIANKST